MGSFFGIFLGAFAIGSCMGCLTSLLTKFSRVREQPSLETALFVLMSYASFLASEAAGFTGIVAVLFCGAFQAHYTFNNLSNSSQMQTREVIFVVAFFFYHPKQYNNIILQTVTCLFENTN
jgi:solute carrier family 9 (sodium/hydrogen exchanger), member 6/7